MYSSNWGCGLHGLCLHAAQAGNLFLLRSRAKSIQNQTATWAKGRFAGVSYALWAHCAVGRPPWANFVGKKISSQTPKTIFSPQSPQNFYYLCNNSSQRSYRKLSAHSDNMDLYFLLPLDSIDTFYVLYYRIKQTSITTFYGFSSRFCLLFRIWSSYIRESTNIRLRSTDPKQVGQATCLGIEYNTTWIWSSDNSVFNVLSGGVNCPSATLTANPLCTKKKRRKRRDIQGLFQRRIQWGIGEYCCDWNSF